MKTQEKLEEINNKIKKINDEILVYKKWKLKFVNRKANDYCLVIILNNEEIFNSSFATYGSVINALNLYLYMFSRGLKELNDKEVKK